MATDTPWARSENPFAESRAPAGGQTPEMSNSSQTAGAHAPGAMNEQDMAVLRAAFTPQVIEALSRLAASGSTEQGATGPQPAMGAMPETPVAEPTLPRPMTQLARMG